MRCLSPRSQVKISCVSDSRLPNGGTILAHLQHDTAKHCTEYIYSTDSALLGVRGLYNFGPDLTPVVEIPHPSPDPTVEATNEAVAIVASESLLKSKLAIQRPQGRLSAGGEVYYGLLNKSAGVSAGLRFTTLPSHAGFPYTMTATLNPLMGNLSATYSVLASRLLALSTRFDFNFYSYESELQVGTEVWRLKSRPLVQESDVNWARLKIGLEPIPVTDTSKAEMSESNMSGCLKARLDQRGGLAMLWEGRVKELLYTCGLTMDLKGGANMFRGVGVEVQYSS